MPEEVMPLRCETELCDLQESCTANCTQAQRDADLKVLEAKIKNMEFIRQEAVDDTRARCIADMEAEKREWAREEIKKWIIARDIPGTNWDYIVARITDLKKIAEVK